MQQIDNKIYTGKILSFNGQFGFIESELGSTFFHKTGLNTGFTPEKNTPVEFKIKKSTKKLGMFDAYNIAFNKNALQKETLIDNTQYILGAVKWFDYTKGYGFFIFKKWRLLYSQIKYNLN